MRILVAALVLSISGCATYQRRVDEARLLLAEGNAPAAVEKLAKDAEQTGKDQLVYLLDYATALQVAGKYKESNRAFLQAEDLAKIQDYHSLSKLTGSLVLSQEMVQYKGELYEKVFINAMTALNFLALGDLEAAQVEVRKINDQLYKFRFEGEKNYNQDPFAFYLSAVIWEDGKEWDNAYINYKKAYEVAPQLQLLKRDLVRAAWRARREEDLEKWQKQWPEIKLDKEADKRSGEIVLIAMQGWAPRKVPNPQFPRVPMLEPQLSLSQTAKLIVEGVGERESEAITSVEEVAMRTLGDDLKALVAKRIAGVAAKAVVADQIRQKNQTLGELAWIGMNLMDRADVRQWSTLPQSFQVARLPVAPGKYKIRAMGINTAGANSGDELPEREVTVKAGRKSFVVWRVLR